jgi:hypothetical protein
MLVRYQGIKSFLPSSLRAGRTRNQSLSLCCHRSIMSCRFVVSLLQSSSHRIVKHPVWSEIIQIRLLPCSMRAMPLPTLHALQVELDTVLGVGLWRQVSRVLARETTH